MMSDSFLYQPHVRESDGVLTPDLVVDRLALARASDPDPTLPLPINLLSCATEIQQLGDTACGSVALVVIAAGRGAVVTVGSDHWDPALAKTGGPAHQTCAKPVSREAIRLNDCGADAEFVLRTFHIRNGAVTLTGETKLGGEVPLGSIVSFGSGGSEPPVRSALFISAEHRDADVGLADGYRVELEHSKSNTRLECAYRVRRL